MAERFGESPLPDKKGDSAPDETSEEMRRQQARLIGIPEDTTWDKIKQHIDYISLARARARVEGFPELPESITYQEARDFDEDVAFKLSRGETPSQIRERQEKEQLAQKERGEKERLAQEDPYHLRAPRPGESVRDFKLRKEAYDLGLKSTASEWEINMAKEVNRKKAMSLGLDPNVTPAEIQIKEIKTLIADTHAGLEMENLLDATKLESSIEGGAPLAQQAEQIAREELGRISGEKPESK